MSQRIVIILTVITFIVFANSLLGSFVWDDRTFIQFNPEITNLSPSHLLGANMFNNVNAGQYRLTVAAYFTWLHQLFGNIGFFYHLMSLFVHLTNVILVFLLFKKFLSEKISLFLALIFAVHPMQVESVSYIAAIGNPLFVLFGLLALLSSRGFVIACCLFASICAKETGIIFFILVPLFQKRLRLWPEIVALLTYFWLRFSYAHIYFSHITLSPISRLDLWPRLENVPAVIFYYIKTFFWPDRLAIEQFWTVSHFFMPLFLITIFFGFFVGFGVYLKNKKSKLSIPYLFFALWFGLSLATYSQIIPLGMTVADRWFYLPIIGLLGMLGILISNFKIFSKYSFIAASLIIIALSVRTIIRNRDWQNPFTLYTHDLSVYPNFDLENSLGGELNLAGKSNEAMTHFQKSVALFPHETNLFNLGLSYEMSKDPQNALVYYLRALTSPGYGEVPGRHIHHLVTYERPAILLAESQPDVCIKITDAGLADYPQSAQLWFSRAIAHARLSQIPKAIQSARNADLLQPQNPAILQLLNQLSKLK